MGSIIELFQWLQNTLNDKVITKKWIISILINVCVSPQTLPWLTADDMNDTEDKNALRSEKVLLIENNVPLLTFVSLWS